ncbi:casein kinase 2 regulatory subunit [Gurleya vavrai]
MKLLIKKSKIKCIEFDSVNDEIKILGETKLQFEKSFLKENILNNENNDLSKKKPNEDLSFRRNPRLIESKDESFESDFFESSDFRKKYNNYEKKEPEKNNFFYDNKINKKGTNDIKISFVNDDKNEGHFEEKLIDFESISAYSGDDCIYEKDIVGINSIYENDEFDDLFSSDLNIESAKNIKLNQDDVKDESIISEKDLDSDVIESIKNKNENIIEELNFNSEIFDEIDQDEIENQDNNLCIAKFKKATLEIKKENKISQNNKNSSDLNFNSAEEDLFSTIDEIYNKSDNIENNNDFISKENNNFFNNNKNAFFTGFVNGLNKKISIKEESLIIANKLNEEITEKEMQFKEDKQKSIFKNDFENEIDKLIKEKCKIRKRNTETFSLENNFSQQKLSCKIQNTSPNSFDKTKNEGRLSNVLLTKKGDIFENKNECFDMKINKKQCFDTDSNFLQNKTNFNCNKNNTNNSNKNNLDSNRKITKNNTNNINLDSNLKITEYNQNITDPKSYMKNNEMEKNFDKKTNLPYTDKIIKTGYLNSRRPMRSYLKPEVGHINKKWFEIQFKWSWLFHFFKKQINIEEKLLIQNIKNDIAKRKKNEFSILKRIVEGDDIPSKYMVLLVIKIDKDRLEVFDGFYSVFVDLDSDLKRLLISQKIRIGSYLRIFGSKKLIENKSIFEINSESVLMLNYNCVKICDKQKLGYQNKKGFCTFINKIIKTGGLISGLEFEIIKVIEKKILIKVKSYVNTVNESEFEKEVEKIQKLIEMSGEKDEHKWEIKNVVKMLVKDKFNNESLFTWFGCDIVKIGEKYRVFLVKVGSGNLGLHLVTTYTSFLEKIVDFG